MLDAVGGYAALPSGTGRLVVGDLPWPDLLRWQHIGLGRAPKRSLLPYANAHRTAALFEELFWHGAERLRRGARSATKGPVCVCVCVWWGRPQCDQGPVSSDVLS